MKIFATIVAVTALALAAPATAAEPGKGVASLYHVATGHQVMFLHWLANQDRASVAAGVGASQLFVHTDGDSWDYLVIYPSTTQAQEDAADAALKKMGVPSGMANSIELRKHIASHTDTLVRGPMTAADYLALLGEK